MATVKPSIVLTSTDALVNALSLSVSDSLAITGQSQYGKVVTSNSKTALFADADFTGAYVYLKNLNTSAGDRSAGTTPSIKILFDSEEAFLIGPGEFAMFPWTGSGNTVYWQAVTGTPELEFAIFEY